MPVIVQRSKRYKQAATKAIPDAVAIDAGVDLLKQFAPTKFDQSVEVIFSLGIDAKQADQMIRGSISLPHGIGKSKRVVCFCPDHLAPAALAAGAIKAGGQSLVQEIEKENFSDFDVAISSPDMMPLPQGRHRHRRRRQRRQGIRRR
jgi:large subunit ribosomal protein L1